MIIPGRQVRFHLISCAECVASYFMFSSHRLLASKPDKNDMTERPVKSARLADQDI